MEEKLFERAKRFLIDAEDDIKKGFFDLAAFHLEQSLQLLIKFLLARKVGYFSKTHSLEALKEEVKKVEPKIFELLENNKDVVINMERAYIGARYLSFEYSKEEIKKMLKLVKKAFKLIK
ncbi:MAG: HEPN domain-containing protein [Candidatus Aenigmatarchaeota archaeon]